MKPGQKWDGFDRSGQVTTLYELYYGVVLRRQGSVFCT